jgi:hypothetical protein
MLKSVEEGAHSIYRWELEGQLVLNKLIFVKKLVEALVVLLRGTVQLRDSFEAAGNLICSPSIQPLLHFLPFDARKIVMILNPHMRAPACPDRTLQRTSSVNNLGRFVVEVLSVHKESTFQFKHEVLEF